MVCVSESSDFQLAPTSIHVTQTTPAIVNITFTRDNIALEPNETVRLRFIQPFTPLLGEFLLDTIDMTIINTDSELRENTEYNGIAEQQNEEFQEFQECICAKYASPVKLHTRIIVICTTCYRKWAWLWCM